MKAVANIKDLEKLSEKIKRDNGVFNKIVTLCAGTGCSASGCLSVLESIKKEIKRANLSKAVTIRATGCHGFCEQGPLMIIEPGNIFYCRIKPEDVTEIVRETVKTGRF